MVLPGLIPLALTVASEFAPGIVRHLAGDKAGDVADTVANVARQVTGADDLDEAAAIARADPAVAAQLRLALAETDMSLEQTRLEEETKRLESINKTIRAEASSQDAFVRRWRPMFGYIAGFSWGTQMAALAWVIVATPEYAAEVITAMASLSVIWSVALAVLGVNITARSRDKQVASGQPPPAGLINTVVGKLTGGR